MLGEGANSRFLLPNALAAVGVRCANAFYSERLQQNRESLSRVE
jgi:hypothetical protein